MKNTQPVTTVDDYIAAFPAHVQQLLKQMRQTIKGAAPQAEEIISYGMPGYKYLGKPLVYFAGYANHIGFYATPTGHTAFKQELAKYKQGKGSVQFSLAEKLPLPLIKRIVVFRAAENEAKNSALKKKLPVKKAIAAKDNTVNNYMAALTHPLKAEAEMLRSIITTAGKKLQERIKWNAPSYYINQTDVLTFNFSDKKSIRIVFHHPTIVKIKSDLLEGAYKDRRIMYLKNSAAVLAAKKELTRIVKEQLKLVAQ